MERIDHFEHALAFSVHFCAFISGSIFSTDIFVHRQIPKQYITGESVSSINRIYWFCFRRRGKKKGKKQGKVPTGDAHELHF